MGQVPINANAFFVLLLRYVCKFLRVLNLYKQINKYVYKWFRIKLDAM